MLVKGLTFTDHLQNVEQMFGILRRAQLKLNLEKCTFDVSSEKFLGYLVSAQGIEANLDKIQTIQALASPTNLHTLQSLIGKIATMGRFLARLSDRCAPLF